MRMTEPQSLFILLSQHVLTKHVFHAIIIMQWRYTQNAKETKRNGENHPCRRMDVQITGRLTQTLHPSNKVRKGYNPISLQRHPKGDRKLNLEAGRT